MARVRTSQITESPGTATPAPALERTSSAARPKPKVSGTTKRKKLAAAPETTMSLWNPAVGQGALLVGLGVCGFIACALASWHPTDPSFSVVGHGRVQNIMGSLGAVVADVLLQGFGYASWAVLGVAGMIVLRLAGRRVGGWGSVIVGGVAFLSLSIGVELLAGADGRAFPAGGLIGAAGAAALAPRLGRVGAGIAVASVLSAAVTILFRINWQPMFARAVDRVQSGVQNGVPMAARAMGSMGVAAVRAGASGVMAARDRLRGNEEEAEDEEEDDNEQPEGTQSQPERASDPGRISVPGPMTRTGAEPRRVAMPRQLTDDRPRLPEAPERSFSAHA